MLSRVFILCVNVARAKQKQQKKNDPYVPFVVVLFCIVVFYPLFGSHHHHHKIPNNHFFFCCSRILALVYLQTKKNILRIKKKIFQNIFRWINFLSFFFAQKTICPFFFSVKHLCNMAIDPESLAPKCYVCKHVIHSTTIIFNIYQSFLAGNMSLSIDNNNNKN